jgi:hypothetical protein
MFTWSEVRTALPMKSTTFWDVTSCSPVEVHRLLRFYSRRYQIFWEVVGLERGPLSLVSTTEELLGRNSSGYSLECREYSRGDPLRWPNDTLYPQKSVLTSQTSGGRSVGIVRSRTKAKEFSFFFLHDINATQAVSWVPRPYAITSQNAVLLSVIVNTMPYYIITEIHPEADLAYTPPSALLFCLTVAHGEVTMRTVQVCPLCYHTAALSR